MQIPLLYGISNETFWFIGLIKWLSESHHERKSKKRKSGCFNSGMVKRRFAPEKLETNDCYGNAKGKLNKVFNSFSHM